MNNNNKKYNKSITCIPNSIINYFMLVKQYTIDKNNVQNINNC